MAALNARRRGSPTGCATPCAEHFAGVRAHLDALGVPYKLDPGLVRGLDYYTRTAFEFYVAGREGQQQAIGGGGRYDGLVELLGGRPTPGIGFGIGLDRLILALAETGAPAATRPPRADPVAVVVGADPDDTAAAAADRDGAARRGDRGPGRPRAAQARQAARGGRSRPRPLRGHPRRRAGRRRGRAARPAGRHAEAGRGRGPRARDRAFARRPPARGRPGLTP